MSIYFADTSAFAKRYLPEPGADWVQSWIVPETRNIIIISALGTIEFISLLARRQREGSVSEDDFNKLREDFLIHAARQYRVIAVSPRVVTQARQLVAKYPLRALDAVQLACALAAAQSIGASITFVSADQKLLSAATAEGFSVDNPNSHKNA